MRRALLVLLALAGCKDFDGAYARCRDAGNCVDLDAGSGGGSATGGGSANGGGSGVGGGTGGGASTGGGMATGGGMSTGGGSGVGGGTGSDGGVTVVVSPLVSHALHSCTRCADGVEACWGDNTFGQLGPGTDAGNSTPVAIPATAALDQLSVGLGFSCGLKGSQAYCWGQGDAGQLGPSSPQTLSLDAALDAGPILFQATSIACADQTACATTQTVDRLTCWGNGFVGLHVVQFAGPVEQLVAGRAHFCARLSNSTVQCFGAGTSGQLGYNGAGDQATPVTALINDVQAIAAGGDTTCAIVDAGTDVYCWGDNQYGQVGIGSEGNIQAAPMHLTLGDGAVAIAIGASHVCAIGNTGTPWCWGQNADGQLGRGTSGNDQPVPIDATVVSHVTRISAGNQFTCAGYQDGGLSCWGANDAGQLGTGQPASPTPRPVLCP